MTDDTTDTTLSRAMQAADQPITTNEIAAALEQKITGPIFNTHSTALAGEFRARADGLRLQIAEVDAKIALLDAERTDLMLTFSMISHGMTAREKGTP